jgi:hypothetical protein
MNHDDVQKSKGFLLMDGIHSYADLERECLLVADEDLNTYLTFVKQHSKGKIDLEVVAVNPKGIPRNGGYVALWRPKTLALEIKRDFNSPRPGTFAEMLAETSTYRRQFRSEAYSVKALTFEAKRRGLRSWREARRQLRRIDARASEERQRQMEEMYKRQKEFEEYLLGLPGY